MCKIDVIDVYSDYVETGGIVYKCTADIGFEIEYVSKLAIETSVRRAQ
jgi:hypothetical protein